MKKVIVGFLLVCLTLIVCTNPVRAATQAEIDAAVTSGMVWLAARQNPDGSWGTLYPVGKTGFAVLKFETHAIQNGTDPLNTSYQYYAQVRNGLDYVFANAYITPISPQPAGDPDTDGDGLGVYFVSGGGMMRTYETGVAMMAIAASTHPEMLVNVPSSAVNGWTYKEVLQDAVDYLAFGQNDAGLQRGGWGYSENQVGFSSNTNTGYAVRALAYAEAPTLDGKTGFSCTIPTFVRDELNIWIDYIQNNVDGDTNDGGSGYTDPNTWVNILKTGNLLFEMAFYGDSAATQRVQDAIDYLVRHWNDANGDPGWRGFPASYQAMYTTVKGFEMLGIYDFDGIDWQSEFADVLLAEQIADGSWPPCIWDDGEKILAAEWALLTLQGIDLAAPTIFILSPENETYSVEDVPLTFTVDEATSWMGYSLDGQANVTITGNTTLMGLLDGAHYVVVYANDTAGNMGMSNTVYFTVDTTPPNIVDVSQIPLEDNVQPDDEVTVNATIVDAIGGVERAALNYTNGNGTWVIVEMTSLSVQKDVWIATIPSFPDGTNVTYVVLAEDNAGNIVTTDELGYEYQYTVIPEFTSLIFLPLFMIATLLAVIVYKREHSLN